MATTNPKQKLRAKRQELNNELDKLCGRISEIRYALLILGDVECWLPDDTTRDGVK